MKINLQSLHFKASENLESLVNEKVSKLFDQTEKIIHADVNLFEGASKNPRNQFCEITLSVPGKNHFVKKNSDSFEKSIDLAVEALQKIVRRKKTKKISARRKKTL